MANQLIISSDLKAAGKVEQRLLREVARRGYGEAAVFALKLAVEEGLNNAIRHGNGFDPKKKVRIEFDIDEHRAVVTITDDGAGFNPAVVPDPTADENIEKPCGRGIMLMRVYMDEVEYSVRGNQVRMVKFNTPA